MDQRSTLVLVDGHALAFRAFFALRDTGMAVRSTGEPTYAVQGFFAILLNLLRDYKPEYVAVSFDVGRTFRDDLYADYKAGRAETPNDFHSQLDRIKQIITALNIPIYTADGYEADDVIGTLARQAAEQNVNTMIITGDTDTLQLVNDYTRVLLANPYMNNSVKMYDADEVKTRYKGLLPNQLADLRGLKGDTSDNIPGVKGIGEAGAISLLNEFGSVEQIYARLDEVPKRYRSKLDGQQKEAEFSKHLATIVTDVPIQLDLSATEVHDYDRAAVLAIFSELEFRKLVDKLPVSGRAISVASIPQVASTSPQQLGMFGDPEPVVQAPAMGFGDYRAVQDEDDLAELVKILESASIISFDVETSALNVFAPQRANVVGISLAVQPGAAWYIPLNHQDGEQLSEKVVVKALKPILEDPQRQRVAHHAKYDIGALSLIDLNIPNVSFDTLIAAALLGKKQGLKDLAFSELRDDKGQPIEMTEITQLIGTGKKQTTFDHVAIADATPYACADVDMTLRLMAIFTPQLAQQPTVKAVFDQIELPLVPVLARMEACGITLDREQLVQQGQAIGATLGQIEQEIYDFVGEPINLQSRFDLNDLLFTRLNLPTQGLKRLAGTTKSGGAVYSIDAEAMDALAQVDPTGNVEKLLRYRRLAKLKSTYIDALQGLINPKTQRVHTQYKQMGAETGRLSSDSPNLQNIPVRSEEGREIRRAFIAQPGHQLLAADYSQIELRVLAHITNDPSLVHVFQTGDDIHAATAAKLFDVDRDKVTKNQRRIAKMTVFGIIYGISSFGLAARTDLSRSEAQQMINTLFEEYPGLRQYIDGTLESVKANGYVETLFGRRRYFLDLKNGTGGPRRQALEREAINAGIQGTAADLIKLAMIKLDQQLHEGGYQSQMLLQVHDELVLEVPDHELPTIVPLVQDIMRTIYPAMRVPLEVNIEVGSNWDTMKRVN